MKEKLKRTIHTINLAIAILLAFVLMKNIPSRILKLSQKILAETNAPTMVYIRYDGDPSEHEYWFLDLDGIATYCCWTCHPAGATSQWFDLGEYIEEAVKWSDWHLGTTFRKTFTLPDDYVYDKDMEYAAKPHWAYFLTLPFPDGTEISSKPVGWNDKDGTNLNNSRKQLTAWQDYDANEYSKYATGDWNAMRDYQKRYFSENNGNKNTDIGEYYLKEAKNHANFVKKLVAKTNKKSDKDSDVTMIKANKSAQKENMDVIYDINTEKIVVGPFKIDYVNGKYGDISFGGITDMYMYNDKGERINIEAFIYNYGTKNEQQVAPKYFTPIDQRFSVDGDDSKYQSFTNREGDENISGTGKTGAKENYPKPNQEFYIEISAKFKNSVNKLHVDFAWMRCEAVITRYLGRKYKVQSYQTEEQYRYYVKNSDGTYYTTALGKKVVFTSYSAAQTVANSVNGQVESWVRSRVIENSIKISNSEWDPYCEHLTKSRGERTLERDSLDIETPEVSAEIDLGGTVWEDKKAGKSATLNGIRDDGEDGVPGVEVFLYYADNPKTAGEPGKDTLVTKNYFFDDSGKMIEEPIVNPVVTDNDGKYLFKGVRVSRQYYIVYKYNGQTYQATQYTGVDLSGGRSNATEIQSEREAYNNSFAEIGSSPENYKDRTTLYKNKGQTNTAWIIGKPSSETPYGIKEVYDYVIQKAQQIDKERKQTLEAAKEASWTTTCYAQAYQDALSQFGNNDTTKSKLQYIEDIRTNSYSGENTKEFNPVSYPQSKNGIIHLNSSNRESHTKIDTGLTKRETFDLAIRKDVQKATLEINGKTHTYKYDTRADQDEKDGGTWDINVRLADGYYNANYSRPLFTEDYQYKASDYGNNPSQYGKTKDDELEVYVTYKITLRNQSLSIEGEVTEIVDYFDEDYEYVDNRSYIKTSVAGKKVSVGKADSSIYGASTSSSIPGYNALYIRGLNGTKMSPGQTSYIFLTFKVKKDNKNGEDWIRLDEKIANGQAIGVGKENIVEVNGYKTYYRNGISEPNIGDVSGKTAGLFDIDSIPGNIDSSLVAKDGNIAEMAKKFEDDTDKAPNIRIILYRENGELVYRQIDGIVWEDERTVANASQATLVGDGKKQDSEKAINGVTVQLIEIMKNGTEYKWAEFSSGQNHFNSSATFKPIINIKVDGNGNPSVALNSDGLIKTPGASDGATAEGKYIFRSYPAGNYVVRYIYGDTIKTVLPNTSTSVTSALGKQGQNAKSYNGQDYKSTTYQQGINQKGSIDGKNPNYWSQSDANLVYKWRDTSTWNLGDETLGKVLTEVPTYKSDFSNNEKVSMGKTSANQQGYLYDIKTSQDANVSDAKDIMSRRNQVIDYSDDNVTNYIAEVLASHEKVPLSSAELNTKLNELMANTKMTAETGLIVVELEYDSTETDTTSSAGQSKQGNNKIKNVNLGLEERPKAQLSMEKKVTNIRVVLADGATLFDASSKATNVLWRNHKAYTADEYYKNYFDSNKYKFKSNPMAQVRSQNAPDAQYGLIQLHMDSELMHGATIKVSYKLTVTNIGEVDYKENSFYYTGKVANKNNVVKTQANQLVDYVANNLQFYKADNDAWKVMTKDEALAGPVNMTLANEINKYNTIITTDSNSKITKVALVPKLVSSLGTSAVSDDLVLTQLITPDNETDDLTYRNIVEIVKTSNNVGRRMAYSVVGNQNPEKTAEITEIDADRAEVVKILPPFGDNGVNYMIPIVIMISALVLIGGIIIIKKVIIKK